MRRFLIAGLVLAAILSGLALPFTTAAAQNVVIDDFTLGSVQLGRTNTGWTPVPPGTSGSTSESGLDPNHTIGGQRDVTLNKLTGSDISPNNNMPLNGGLISYNSTFGDTSTWTLSYGLGGDLNADLTAGGNNDRVRLDMAGQIATSPGVAPGTPMTLTIFSGSSSFSISENLVGSSDQSPVSYEYLFTDFPGIDFTDVDRIVLEFVQDSGNAAVDYAITGITATAGLVPTEQASMGQLKSIFR